MSGRLSLTSTIGAALLLAGAGSMVLAQSEGEKNAGPVDTQSFEVQGVTVDVRGATAEAARQGGWRIAQRKGWEKLSQQLTGKRSTLSDSALDSLVTGIVVEQEQIGPQRYIASLGVLFDRGKAAGILGVSGALMRSPPMVLVPIEWSGGVGRAFERDTQWREAWDRFRAGNSTIDYVRPRGTGPDAMLLNAGQVGRRGRNWWRDVLDQFGASDVLVAEVMFRREFPGGPVTGIFKASHGPDKIEVAEFALRVDSADAIPALLDAGVARIDQAYQDALARGELRTDRLLAMRPPSETVKPEEEEEEEGEEATPTPTPGASETTASFTVQVETPSAASVSASESSVRGIPGVRSAATTSLALGGISVMRVSYDGSIGGLRAALEARGWSVQEGSGVLRIRRPGGGGAADPAPTDDANGG
jgi:hypothetical protein